MTRSAGAPPLLGPILALLFGLAACGQTTTSPQREAEPEFEAEPEPEPEPTRDSMTSADFDPSIWDQRCIVVQGYAVEQKLGPLLDLGGPTLGVVFPDDGDWPVAIGSLVRVEGIVRERADLPVFVADPSPDPEHEREVAQGIPVPPGTDLDSARRRFVIEQPKVRALRSVAEVEAALAGRVGETVSLTGTVWSRNGSWTFNHDGVVILLEPEPGTELDWGRHGQAVIVRGELGRVTNPALDVARSSNVEAKFWVHVEAFEPHPTWSATACDESTP